MSEATSVTGMDLLGLVITHDTWATGSRGSELTVTSGGWSETSTATDDCPRSMFEGSEKAVLRGWPTHVRQPPTSRYECQTINTSSGGIVASLDP